MNYIWCIMILFSLAAGFINGNIVDTVNAGFKGAAEAVTVLLSFAGVMCFWTGILKIAEKSGISDFIEKLFSPIVKFLFPNTGQNARKFISMNMTANLLGMGNAATPMGIKAMEELDKENENPLYASDSMCMLVVINTASLQLIPSTIISLRIAAGSQSPLSIILPIWIVSILSLTISVFALKAYIKISSLVPNERKYKWNT